MKLRAIFFVLYLLMLAPDAGAQIGLQNANLEFWRRRQFRCCGRNVDLPGNWGTPEQSCGINFNKFVFLEDDPNNVHSGLYSALLFSDTSFFNDVVLQPGMLVYGGYQDPLDSAIRIGQPVEKYGLPVDSNPMGLKFWLKMSHGLPDTFSYVYVFTRWDSVAHHTDTLSYETKDIADSQVPQDAWFEVSDSIHYLHAGRADTLKMIFYGGRFGNPALATNMTWIDDMSFYYQTPQPTGIAPEASIDDFGVYPNPANNVLRIRSGKSVEGYIVEIYDDLGRLVLQTPLLTTIQVVDISRLTQGHYVCRIVDENHHSLYQAKVSVVR